ncbi:MAG: hypothetical protein J1F20_01810 [Muribaculaceae bacterium]|nr:hypothetical protein [Muribaculaceae bacterium]
MKKLYIIFSLLVLASITGVAQIITTNPPILQESTDELILTYHADSPLGNDGLKGLGKEAQLYFHIGVITDKSSSGSDWRYTVSEWPNGNNASKANLDKNRLTYVSTDTWQLNIGNVRTFFGITDPEEHVRQIAIVARNADGTREGKTKNGSDIYVDVLPEGFQMKFSTTATDRFITEPTTVSLSVFTTENADLSITLNGIILTQTQNATELSTTYLINEVGNYDFLATASCGEKYLSESLRFTYPAQSTLGIYPGGIPQMGSIKNSDGTVTFCIAAPGKSSVILVPSWDDYQILDKNIMSYQDYNGYRYFFITVSGLADNVYYPYYYIVDGTYKVADPYARLVLDNNYDKWIDNSIWPDMPKYPYERFDDTMLAVYRGDMDTDFSFSPFNIPDPSSLVVYELLFRDFTGTEGEAAGSGTIATAMGKLDYLKDLGVNAIELMPVMEFNGNNSWGYNTNFYFAPDKAYGSPRQLKAFIEGCHQRGMAVILDIVFNQSDGMHPWYQMYSPAENPFYNITAPHAYSVLNDWKQENPLVRQQWKDAIRYWMTAYNVDGFRFDLVKGLGTTYSGNTDAYNASRVQAMKDLHEAITSVKANGIHINENLAEAREENEMAEDGQLNWANINYASAQYAMGVGSGSNLQRFDATHDNRLWGSTVSYAESHDEERLAYRQLTSGVTGVKGVHDVSMKRLGQVAVQILMMPGPKMIWQFGELGADQTTKNGYDNNTEPKKVVWSYLDDSDRRALHDTYRALCNFRKLNPSLFDNTATLTLTGFADNITSNRIIRLTNGDKEVMAFINPNIGGANRSVGATSTKLNSNNAILITASKDYDGSLYGTGTSVSVSLPPHGYAVYATSNVAGMDNLSPDNLPTVKVYGSQGHIVIDGAYQHADVYDISGRSRSLEGLDSGIYIVVVDGTIHKALVN